MTDGNQADVKMVNGLSAEDEAAIERSMQEMADAWRAGDGAAYGAAFAEDAEYLAVTGDVSRGREEIGRSHQRIFDTFFKNTRLSGKGEVSMRAIAPGVAVVRAKGAVLFANEKDGEVAPNGIVKFTFVRRDGEWRAVDFQNTPVGKGRMLKFLVRYAVSRMKAGRGSKVA
jgi:uncharacterized protein (TIGR02246 family)